MKKSLLSLFLILLICGLQAQTPTLQQAETAFRVGDFEQAAVFARQILTNDPNSVGAHIILGVIRAQRSEWADSERHFKEVVRLAPSNAYGYFYLGQAYLYQQRWEKAAQYFVSALERGYPDRARLIIELALAQTEAGQPNKALARLTRMQPPARAAEASQYHAVMAFAYAAQHEPAQAIRSMRKAREQNPLNPEYWSFIISQLVQTNQLSLAVSEAIQAQKKFPDHPEIQFLFGLSSSELGNIELIKIALRNIMEIESSGARALMLQGMLHRHLGRTDEAIADFRRAANQGIPDSHLLLGLVLKDSGDFAGAERELRKAEQLNPGNGQIQFELGKLLLSQGELSEALPYLRNAAQYMPSAPMVHYQLATLYRRLGQKDNAAKSLQTFQNLKKQADEARAASPIRPRQQ